MRTIIVEEMMMVDLRSDQPTKMTPQSILLAYKADMQTFQENNSTSDLIGFSKIQKSMAKNNKWTRQHEVKDCQNVKKAD